MRLQSYECTGYELAEVPYVERVKEEKMVCWGLTILFFIFGLLGLVKGEFSLTKNRRITGTKARVIGVVCIVIALLGLLTALSGEAI